MWKISVASFTKEVNPRLTKRPLVFNGLLADRGLISLVKETIGVGVLKPGSLISLSWEILLKQKYWDDIFKYIYIC